MSIHYRGMIIVLHPWEHSVAMTWHLPNGQEGGSGETFTKASAIALARKQINQLLDRDSKQPLRTGVQGWIHRFFRRQ